MKKLAIIKSENQKLIDIIKNKFFEQNVLLTEILSCESNLNDYDLIVDTNFNTKPDKNLNINTLGIWQSLLPAFKNSVEPLKDAFLYGVKVSGVTIQNLSSGKILAQFPVLIGNCAHYDEYCSEINSIIEKLYPPVIDSVLNDRVFDFTDLYKTSTNCHADCNGCGRCKH